MAALMHAIKIVFSESQVFNKKINYYKTVDHIFVNYQFTALTQPYLNTFMYHQCHTIATLLQTHAYTCTAGHNYCGVLFEMYYEGPSLGRNKDNNWIEN